jgi:hypothetical protein
VAAFEDVAEASGAWTVAEGDVESATWICAEERFAVRVSVGLAAISTNTELQAIGISIAIAVRKFKPLGIILPPRSSNKAIPLTAHDVPRSLRSRALAAGSPNLPVTPLPV